MPKFLEALYDDLYYDGYGWWLPDWFIGEDEHNNKPSWEEFLKAMQEKSQDPKFHEYEDVKLEILDGIYDELHDTIEPLVEHRLLPASVVESMIFLVDFYKQSLKEGTK